MPTSASVCDASRLAQCGICHYAQHQSEAFGANIALVLVQKHGWWRGLRLAFNTESA